MVGGQMIDLLAETQAPDIDAITRLQAITGENGCRLIKLLMTTGPAAPQTAIVHCRQIIVNQRVAMQKLDSRANPQGTSFINGE